MLVTGPAKLFPAELLTVEEMVAAERAAMAAGTPGIELMERAGAAVAKTVVAGLPHGGRVAVACGPGNNGGDGFVVARVLAARGYTVAVGLLGAPEKLKGDAAEAARRWGARVAPIADLDLADASLVVDALFGTGLGRALDGEARAAVERINASGKPIIAVDVPSGLDSNTGKILGAAVRASATVTFFRLKPGHLLMPGRPLCGELEVADIGIPDSALAAIRPEAFANIPALWRRALPVPAMDGHKYARGHALVVSGGAWTTGAARLAARGALRAGAGLVTVASPREALTINASHLTAIMLRPCDGPADLGEILRDPRFNAVVMGPGLGVGEATRAMVRSVLEAEHEGRSLVLDADALTSFAGRGRDLKVAMEAAGTPVVITPHEGEFTRLFNAQGRLLESISQPVESVSHAAASSKLARTRNAAREIGAVVLLKGPDTVVAHPDGRASIGFDAPPWLATAGSGDVLAGIIGALRAQGMPAFEAASAAVWMHAAAARGFGPGLISEDLPEAFPGVWRELLTP